VTVHKEDKKILERDETTADACDGDCKKQVKKVKGWINSLYVESIILDGKPCFLCCDKKTSNIGIIRAVETRDRIYVPLEEEDQGYIPYKFSEGELEKILELGDGKETLLDEISRGVEEYINADANIKHLLQGDLFLTYCQEWITTTHFLYCVGETESGKSSVLHLFKHLAYRCLYGVEIPTANIYNFLGKDEEATGTIAEDEAQDMEFERDKIRLYKSSYESGSVKPIVYMTKEVKRQVYYKTFCFKLFAGERVPDDKGFEERLAVVHMVQGLPKKNIKFIDNQEREAMEFLRKRLLVWKVRNIEKGLEPIDSDLKLRDQELWEDFLRISSGTKYHEKFQGVVDFFIRQRQSKIKDSLEARIFDVMKDILNSGHVNFEELWERITGPRSKISGILEKGTYLEHETGRRITRNSLSKILEEKFQGIKNSRIHYGRIYPQKTTSYIFDKNVLETLAKKYNPSM